MYKETRERKMNNQISYMFEAGFLGTRAPFFMDFVTLIVAFLPFLVAGAISFARNMHYKAHSYSHIFIFAFSVIVLFYFEYGVRVSGGFDSFMKGSHVSHDYALFVLIFHIIISLITLVIWGIAIFMAKKLLQLGKHRRVGLFTFAGVVLTSLTGIWVYFLMFVY
jgi:putative membrane protein